MFSFKCSFWTICLFLLARRRAALGSSVVLLQHNMTTLTAQALQAAGYDLDLVEHLSVVQAPRLRHVAVEDLTLMPNLRTLMITEAPQLHRLAAFPPLPALRTLMVTSSGLTETPNLSHIHDERGGGSLPYLLAVDLEGNHIRRLPTHALRIRADQVSLNYNLLEEVPAYAFKNAQISKLSFRGNKKLKKIDENAFTGNLLLRSLDLTGTAIASLPTRGLEKLETLRVQSTPTLKYIPSLYELQKLQRAYLTHHFHCCAFKYPERHDPARHALYETQMAIMAARCSQNQSKGAGARKARSVYGLRRSGFNGSNEDTSGFYNGTDSSSEADEFDPYSSDYDSEQSWEDEAFHAPVERAGLGYSADCGNFSISPRVVECSPQPDALNPCEDVMGWAWLRASVWLVVAAAVAGNVAVLAVLLARPAELSVPRLLMCHLALADLCTGCYLLMLAVVDLTSYGEFFNHAYDWQYGAGCKVAGFLSVFSGQLSVITLSIVTLERWFAITYAMYLERRIGLACSAKIMAGGWAYSLTMAGLPLLGVSDYSSTSICLPVESAGAVDAVYQGSLFLTNAAAWVTIVVCYVQIYRSLGGGGEGSGGRAAAAAAERRIAKKMAVLVGTDLLCWAPVAFFGVTALAGAPLVDVSHGKVLLVFFYPLNACANPFLYAILTKQYRRDLLSLLGRTGRCGWLLRRYKTAAPPPTGHTHPTAVPLVPLPPPPPPRDPPHKDAPGDAARLV